MPPKIDVTLVDVRPIPDALIPTMGFHLEVRNTSGEPATSCLLVCDVFMKVIEAGKSRELFWGTMRIPVKSKIDVGQTVPCHGRLACTYDVDLSVSRYLSVVGDEIPLKLVLYGNYTWGNQAGVLTDIVKEYALPASRWKKTVLEYYRDILWIAIRKDTCDELEKIIEKRHLHTHDEAIRSLMKESTKPAGR